MCGLLIWMMVTTQRFVSLEFVIGQVTSPGNSFADLQKEINAVDTLILDKDYIYSANDNSSISITKSITIDGNGHTLDGNAMSRIFKVVNGTVVFKNIKFVNGSAVNGSAIFGECLVINCTFINNNASYGGAMYQGTAVNCTFINNRARYGGAIFAGEAVNCTFDNNQAIEKGNNIYGIYLRAYDFNSGEKLFVYLENSPVSISGKNVTIKVYKDNVLVSTYYTLSGDGWIVDLGVGNYTAVLSLNDSVYYADDVNTTITVEKLDSKLSATPVTAIYKDDKYLIVTLKDNANNPVVGAAISVDINGVKNLITDSNGQVKVSLKDLTPKSYSASITFAGNDNCTGSAAKVKVTVKKATPTLTATKKSFKVKTKTKKYAVTLKDNKNNAVKNAKITLKIKGKTYKATTNAKGKATFKITKLTKKGTFKATITFAGDSYYNKATKTVKISVKK